MVTIDTTGCQQPIVGSPEDHHHEGQR